MHPSVSISMILRPFLSCSPNNLMLLYSSYHNAKLSVEREPVIGQTLIDICGLKPAWEGILKGEGQRH